MYQDFWTYILLNLIFSCNFIPKLKCCRVSFKSQKCASLSCAQWDIWLTFKYLLAPLHASSKKSYISSKRNPISLCDKLSEKRKKNFKKKYFIQTNNILLILIKIKTPRPWANAHKTFKFKYRTRAIITRGLYIFYPLFEVQKRFFKGLHKILALCMVSI